jgi:hypothetical protein
VEHTDYVKPLKLLIVVEEKCIMAEMTKKMNVAMTQSAKRRDLAEAGLAAGVGAVDSLGNDQASISTGLKQIANDPTRWEQFRGMFTKATGQQLDSDPVKGTKTVLSWCKEHPVYATIVASVIVAVIGIAAYAGTHDKDERTAAFANDDDDFAITKAIKSGVRAIAGTVGFVDSSKYAADGTLAAAGAVSSVAQKAYNVKVLCNHLGGAKEAIAFLEALASTFVADIVEIEALRTSLR